MQTLIKMPKYSYWICVLYILFVLDLPFAVQETADLGEVAVPLHHVVQHGGLHQEGVVTLYQEVYIFIGEQKSTRKRKKAHLGSDKRKVFW